MVGVGLVFHLAAQTSVPFSVADPEFTADVNVGGTVNLLAAAVKAKVGKFVFASSCAVYGDPKVLPVKEEDAVNPISPYAESKLAGEVFCLGLHKQQLLRCFVFRFFNVYGSRQGLSEYSGVIRLYFEACRERVPLTVFGDGSQTRDFVHVSDVVDVLLSASKCEDVAGQVFNVGTGKPVTIGELAVSVLRVTGKDSGIVYAAPRAGDIKHSYADISKASRLLGYRPKIRLRNWIAHFG